MLKFTDQSAKGDENLPLGPRTTARPVHAATSFIQHDAAMVDGLRAGDERAFLALVSQLHGRMVVFARVFVHTDAAAEDVVQDTWAAVIRGIARFGGRSPLRTWIFGIVANLARTRAVSEGRSISLMPVEGETCGPAVDPADFYPHGHPCLGGQWCNPPQAWPDEKIRSAETIESVQDAIHRLPERQRSVIQLRDVEGLGAEEVCDALGLSDANQRVLLHRARTRVRREMAHAIEISPATQERRARDSGP